MARSPAAAGGLLILLLPSTDYFLAISGLEPPVVDPVPWVEVAVLLVPVAFSWILFRLCLSYMGSCGCSGALAEGAGEIRSTSATALWIRWLRSPDPARRPLVKRVDRLEQFDWLDYLLVMIYLDSFSWREIGLWWDGFWAKGASISASG